MYRKSSSFSIIAVLLIAAVVVFCGLGSAVDGKWFQNGDLATWYNYWGKGPADQNQSNNDNNDGSNQNTQNGSQENPNTTVVSNAGSFGVTDSYDEGLTLLCAPISDLVSVSLANAPANYVSAYQLTVTAAPVAAAVPAVDWAVAWSNASSTWATGKTVGDYVVVVPDSDGAATATAYCLQAFGEPVVLSVTGRVNSALTSSVNCHWLRTVESLQYEFAPSALNMSNFVLNNAVDFSVENISGYDPSVVYWAYESGIGSVSCIFANEPYTRQSTVDQTSATVTIQITRQFATALYNAGLSPASPDTNISFTYNSNTQNIPTGYFDFIALFFGNNQIHNGSAVDASNYNKFMTACQAMGNTTAIRVTIAADFVGFGSKTTSFDMVIDASSAAFIATSLSLSEAEVVFYATPAQNNGGSGNSGSSLVPQEYYIYFLSSFLDSNIKPRVYINDGSDVGAQLLGGDHILLQDLDNISLSIRSLGNYDSIIINGTSYDVNNRPESISVTGSDVQIGFSSTSLAEYSDDWNFIINFSY